MTASKKSQNTIKKINLALQGGGAHGAFTWGVLDVLASDPRLKFEGITATSAGAMNAAVFVSGYHNGGPTEGLRRLESFWRDVSNVGFFAHQESSSAVDWMMSLNPFMKNFTQQNGAMSAAFDGMTHLFSPYQFNPLNINPLEHILERHIDVKALRNCDEIRVFVTATHVQSGTPRVFSNQDLSIKSLLASAALPMLFQAVKIGTEHYWDGGYMGNPSLWPLFYDTVSRDIVIVHVNPLRRHDLPTDAYAIENRINEITFNSAMLKELRAIAFAQKLVDDKWLKPEYQHKIKSVLLHAVRNDDYMDDLTLSSKFDSSWPFLQKLREAGQKTATSWLRKNFDALGDHSSVDIHRDYLDINQHNGSGQQG
jgi:NTE family protein